LEFVVKPHFNVVFDACCGSEIETGGMVLAKPRNEKGAGEIHARHGPRIVLGYPRMTQASDGLFTVSFEHDGSLAVSREEKSLPAPLRRPGFALEHLEHLDLGGGQGIAFDGLRMLHLEPTRAGGLVERAGLLI
jgi:hypothetical protein